MKNLYEIAKLIYPDSARKRVRFIFKASVRGRKYVEGVAEIFEDKKLTQIIEANPRQYEKIFRPYLFATLRLDGRLKYIQDHYDFTREQWSGELIEAVYVHRYFEIANFKAGEESGDEISIALSRESSFANEGEIFVSVGSKQHGGIFSLNFNFTKVSDGSGMLIGCMQGPASQSAREVVRQITKDMHGLRPHHLLTFALQKIAAYYGLHEIKAVTTEGHVYNADAKGRRIKTDYNGFWEEAGGEMSDDGFYLLPLVEERKSMEEIKSNKRAMYRRRFEMMDMIAEQISKNLAPTNS